MLSVSDLPIISDSDCVAAGVETDEWKITPDMVCVGGQVGKDSCKVRIDWIITFVSSKLLYVIKYKSNTVWNSIGQG